VSKTEKHNIAPFMLNIDRDNEVLFVKRYEVAEYGEDIITNEEFRLDGTEMKTVTGNSSILARATWDESSGILEIVSTTLRKMGERIIESKSTEKWKLQEDGNTLNIIKTIPNRQGTESTINIFYSRNRE